MTTQVAKLVPIGRVRTSGRNPRKTFPADKLAELAATIKIHGILQPLVVRSLGHKKDWELIAGERRLRAAKLAGLTEVPVHVVDVTDEEAGALALIENDQREDVNILERVEGYHSQIKAFGWSVKKLADQVGQSQSTVRALLKLADLPELSKQALSDGRISVSLATLIAERPTAELRERVETWVFGDGDDSIPSVRDTKEYIRQFLTVELKGAPFSTTAKKLVPDAGSCKDCPKRLGNMEEDHSGRADVCTDPACYREKVEAHHKGQAADWEKQGYNVIGEAEAATVFGAFGQVRVDSIYYDLDDDCRLAPPEKRGTWGKLIGGMLPAGETFVRVESGGRVRKLVKKRWAEAALDHVVPKPEPKPAAPLPERLPLDTIPLQEQIDNQDAEFRAEAMAIFRRATTGVSPGVFGEPETRIIRLLVWQFVEDGGSEEIEESIRIYHQIHPDVPDAEVPDEPDIEALSGPELLRYAAAQIIARFTFMDFRGSNVVAEWFKPAEKAGAK